MPKVCCSWIVGLLLTAILVPSAFAQDTRPSTAPRGAETATPVAIDTVRTEPFVQTAPLLGRMVPRQAGIVAARVAGPVAAVHAYVGDRVKAGAPLVTVDTDALTWTRAMRTADVAQQDAAIKKAESELELARQEMARLERLRASAAFSQARYDDKRLDVTRHISMAAEAKAKLDMARANLRMAEMNVADAVIRAPYSGVVAKRHTDVGSYLKVGDSAMTLISDTDLEIEADVPVDRLPGLKPGTQIVAELGADMRTIATVRAVIPDENPLARTQAVRLTMGAETRDVRLAQNQSATLLVPMGAPRQVVTVHKDAILLRNGERVVFIVQDGKAVPRTVQLGESLDGRFEVVDGLRPGEVVVTRGNERLRAGQAVVAQREGPGAT